MGTLGRNSVSYENVGVGELGRVTEPTLPLQESTKVFELLETCGEKQVFLKNQSAVNVYRW